MNNQFICSHVMGDPKHVIIHALILWLEFVEPSSNHAHDSRDAAVSCTCDESTFGLRRKPSRAEKK